MHRVIVISQSVTTLASQSSLRSSSLLKLGSARAFTRSSLRSNTRRALFSTQPPTSEPAQPQHDPKTAPLPGKETEKKKKPAIDKRVWPIAASTLVGGCAVGVLFPVMPIFVQELGLSAKDFGFVVSIVGLTRLLVNVPAAWATDRFGRRSTLIGGPIISGIGMFFIASSRSLMELATFRFLTGVGGSFQMTGAQMYLSDISTKENRARTMAPMGIAFATGATIGPAIGGYLAESFGLRVPFYFVASAIATACLLNYRLIPETKVAVERPKDSTISSEFKSVVAQWRPLLKDPDMRRVLLLNMTYWSVASGCQWTLLPLVASSQYNFSVSDIGGMFALLSAIGIVGLGPAAYISDKFGRKFTIFPAATIVSASLAAMSFAHSKEQLLGLAACYAVGATLFNSAPAAFVADITKEDTRGQALALLRSAGDAGLFFGATGFGALAHATSPAVAFGVGSAALVSAGLNFTFGRTSAQAAASAAASTSGAAEASSQQKDQSS